MNQDTESARSYHDGTKHSFAGIRSSPHYLDWLNRPSPFKIYPDLEPLPLPRDLLASGVPALAAIASPGAPTDSDAPLNLDLVASFLYYSGGVTKKKSFPGGEIYFRAAACAGALYPIETYLVSGPLEGLEAGVYHFSPGDFSLRRLRTGDFRGVLARATDMQSDIVRAPLALVYSAISWRSTWKYRDRAYRYHFWDNGMIVANVLAKGAAHGIPAGLVMGFIESDVNELIGIDGDRELALSLVALGAGGKAHPAEVAAPIEPRLVYRVLPLSDRETAYPSIPRVHAASSLLSAQEVAAWRQADLAEVNPPPAPSMIALAPITAEDLPGDSIEGVIQRRASTRHFARRPITFAALSSLLDRATRGIPSDFGKAAPLNEIYAIVNRVEELEPGSYFHRRTERALEKLKEGDFSERAAYLTLEQDLGGDSSVTVFFMTDLARVLAAYGNRGYRAAQMEAGTIGGKIYLGAYALGLGATGLTFYDDDVTSFFCPHAEGKSCMLAVSIGVPGKRPIL